MCTTHLQLQCEPLQKLDPNYELAFFTRQLFAKMHREFEQVPKEVYIQCDKYLLFVRHEGKRLILNPCNFNNVKDSLNELEIKWSI